MLAAALIAAAAAVVRGEAPKQEGLEAALALDSQAALEPAEAFEAFEAFEALDAEEGAEDGEAEAEGPAPGALLEGFALLEPLPGTRVPVEALVQLNATHGKFPLGDEWAGPKYLSAGSFGEAWAATDKKGRKVCLKLFYRKDAWGRTSYLRSGELSDDEDQAVKSAVKECTTAQTFVNLAAEGDPGKGRILRCFKERATGRPRGAALYLVLEFGGQSLHDWLHGQGRSAGLVERRAVVGQLLQGLRLMHENLRNPFVHHDLKPANTVYTGMYRKPNGNAVLGKAKIIDFGCTMKGVRGNQHGPAAGTAGYAPPEYLGLGGRRVNFAFPVHSYDIYALGLMYAQVLCPVVDFARGLVPVAQSPYKSAGHLRAILPRHCAVPAEDQALILRMLAWDPKQRPSASELLQEAPFQGQVRQLIKEPEVLEKSAGDTGDLERSIPAMDRFNPGVQNGAALVVGGGEMEELRRCEYKFSEPLLSPGDFGPSGKRAQCSAACAEAAAAQWPEFDAAVQRHPVCCMMEGSLPPGAGYGARYQYNCFWGYGRLMPPREEHGRMNYAKHIAVGPPKPLDARRAPAPDRGERARGPPPVDARRLPPDEAARRLGPKPVVRDAKPDVAPVDPLDGIQWHVNPRYKGEHNLAGDLPAEPDYGAQAAQWQKDFAPEPQSPRDLKQRITIAVEAGSDPKMGMILRDNPEDNLCKVVSVRLGALADRAGIKLGDQLKALNVDGGGRRTKYLDCDGMVAALRALQPGDVVKFHILRSAPPGARPRKGGQARPSGLRNVEAPQVRKQPGGVRIQRHEGRGEPYQRPRRKPEVAVDPRGVGRVARPLDVAVGNDGPVTAVLELS